MAVHYSARRRLQGILIFALCGMLITFILLDKTDIRPVHGKWYWKGNGYIPSSFDWSVRTPAHPVDPSDIAPLPSGPPHTLPRVQHRFTPSDLDAAFNQTQLTRRNAVRDAAKKSWDAYRTYAYGRDEVRPLSLRPDDTFAGWGATLVDSLDTLWIMGFHAEFHDAVLLVARIDWNTATSPSCSLFETTIRYLGGLLSAHDLSGSPILLAKALELGHLLLSAFDTPSHLPANTLDFSLAKSGLLVASPREASAVLGTLSLEFTRLSQLTGDSRFHSAIDRIKGHLLTTQNTTKLPGMWPVHLSLHPTFHASDSEFSLGALSDSLYEYLPKTYSLLAGTDPAYRTLYLAAADTIQSHLLFSPMLPPSHDPSSKQEDILLPGTILSNGAGIIDLLPELQHLSCFAGGMFALGGRLFANASHIDVGARLARGCAWAYEAFPAGLMPELSEVVPCPAPYAVQCKWNETLWEGDGDEEGLPKPWVSVRDAGWRLRPEAVESLFVMWRVTGEREWVERAWGMWEAVVAAAGGGEEGEEGFAMVEDVRVKGGRRGDSMESFWIAETLKYFYLIFSDPELISLDDYVLNTEAHPFRLPKPGDEGIVKQGLRGRG